ncbi:MAG: DUF58 domain-containing protein [Clostridia bacterium]
MTKRNVIYFIVFICVLILALYREEKILYTLVFTIMILPLLSLIFLIITVLKYRYTERLDKMEIIRGDVIKYSLDVYNKDFFLYPFVRMSFYSDSFTAKSVFSDEVFYILPRSKYHIEKEIICDHIGNYDVGVRLVEFRDYFGFFKLSRTFHNKHKKISILPRITELNHFKALSMVSSESSHYGSRFGMEDYSEIAEIKKYTSGLPLKKIHWKLSAKRNELMIKDFNASQNSSAYLFIDINRLISNKPNDMFLKDIIIESTLAILKFCLKKSISIHVSFNDMNFSKLRVDSKKDFNCVYDRLFKMGFEGISPFADMFNRNKGQLLDFNNLIIIAADYTNDLFDSLVKLKLSGKRVTLLSSVSSKPFIESYCDIFLEGLLKNGINVYKVSHADEIKKALEI